MRLMLLVMIFIITLLSCQTKTKYITVPLTTAPAIYNIADIKTQKDLLKEYQKSIIKIAEWQKWYNINKSSDYYNYTNKTRSK